MIGLGKRRTRTAALTARAALVVATAVYAQPCEPATWREARALMGTVVEIETHGPGQPALRRAAAAAYREMARLTNIMSHYDPANVVSAINRAAGVAPVAAPDELLEVLAMAQQVSRASGGAFDVTVGALGWRFNTEGAAIPRAGEIERRRALVDYRDLAIDEARGTVFLRRRGMRLDLGGIAKLYILHAGMKVLRRRGLTNAMINGGGDFVVSGGRRARPWRIGIHDPRRPDALLGVIELREGLVASSGNYERSLERNGEHLHHLIDPATGWPTQGLAQVTLLARTLKPVNGYSAALMVLGYERARRFIEAAPALEGLLVAADGRVWISPGLRPHLTQAPRLAD